MNSEQIIYKSLTEIMLNSFLEFLEKLDAMDAELTDADLISKFHKINASLQKLCHKYDAKMPLKSLKSEKTETLLSNGLEMKRKSTATDSFVETKIKLVSTDVKHSEKTKLLSGPNSRDQISITPKPCYVSESDKLFKFEKSMIFAKKEIEGSDDDDDDNKYVSSTYDERTLFETDYPITTEMSKSDSESSMNTSSSISTSKEKIFDEINDPSIRQIIDDVFQCTICGVNNLPKNNIRSHINGKQHKNSLKKSALGDTVIELKHTKSSENMDALFSDVERDLIKQRDGTSFIVPGNHYHCTVCKNDFNSHITVLQHVASSKHRKNCDIKHGNEPR